MAAVRRTLPFPRRRGNSIPFGSELRLIIRVHRRVFSTATLMSWWRCSCFLQFPFFLAYFRLKLFIHFIFWLLYSLLFHLQQLAISINHSLERECRYNFEYSTCIKIQDQSIFKNQSVIERLRASKSFIFTVKGGFPFIIKFKETNFKKHNYPKSIPHCQIKHQQKKFPKYPILKLREKQLTAMIEAADETLSLQPAKIS